MSLYLELAEFLLNTLIFHLHKKIVVNMDFLKDHAICLFILFYFFLNLSVKPYQRKKLSQA